MQQATTAFWWLFLLSLMEASELTQLINLGMARKNKWTIN